MVDSNLPNVDSDIEIRRDAYQKVLASWEWMNNLAKQEKYYDGYIEAITEKSDLQQIGVMPIAELLMCLVNTTQEKYHQLGLPQPSPDLIKKITNDLISTYNANKFSGVPYLRCSITENDPPFTDAVCYTAAALNCVLALSELYTQNIKEKCENLLITCLNWLLEAAITSDKWELLNGMEGVRGSGWSWTSPIDINRDEAFKELFDNCFPPQTYFTSQVFVTLQEILFENYDLIFKINKTEETLQAIVNAKKFLLTSLYKEEFGTKVGWCDYIYDKSSPDRNITKMIAYSTIDVEKSEVNDEMSLYPLESLSYVKYYANYQYQIDDLKKKFPKLEEEYRIFSDEELQKLNQVFDQSLAFLNMETIYNQPCKIQVPEPLSLFKGEIGYLQSNQNPDNIDNKSFYIDGTVAYNCLNALTFYAEHFTPEKANKEKWDKSKAKIVKRVLNKAFQDQGFAHCGSGIENDPFVPSIYATRTAVACLLSWGVSPIFGPPIPSVDIDEARNLLSKLNLIMNPEVGSPPGVTSPLSLKKESLEQLLSFVYLIGLTMQILKNTKKWEGNPQVLFDPKKMKEKADIQTLIFTNGRGFLKVLAIILTSNDKQVIKSAIDEFTKQVYLINPVKTSLEKNATKLSTADLAQRISIISSITDQLFNAFGDLGIGDHFIKDLYETL